MCFYADYDWYADIHEETCFQLDEPGLPCDECGQLIPQGAWRVHVYQQENETCHQCDDLDSDEEHDGKCDYGETTDYNCCVECSKIIAGVEEYERRQGCPEGNRRPPLYSLYESVQQEHLDSEELLGICKAICDLSPEMENHKWVVETREQALLE